MDIEHLNKKQIILLTLLVSFVTSIATGIVTVSLMSQMPPPVTQTINRVVERTLERVVEKKTDASGNVTTKEKTVVVKETDLISQAVQAALPSLVSVYVVEHAPTTADAPSPSPTTTQSAAAASTTADAIPQPEEGSTKGGKDVRRFLARGVFMSDSVVVTDASQIPDGAVLEVVTSISRTPIIVSSVTKKGALATLILPNKSGVGIQRGDAQVLQLGNTLVSLGGEERLQVSTGVVSDLDRNDAKQVTGISLDTAAAVPGSALVNLEGKLVAVYAKGAWVLQ